MRKLYALLLTVVMLTALTMSALAAQSPAAVAKESVAAVVVEVAGATVTQASTALVQDVFSLVNNDEHMANLGVPANANVAAVVNINFTGEIPAGGVQIPIKVENAEVGDYVIVLHRCSTTGVWSVVGRGVLGADKTIVGTFLSFSPVVILKVDAANYAAAGIRAPKTGQ